MCILQLEIIRKKIYNNKPYLWLLSLHVLLAPNKNGTENEVVRIGRRD